MMIVRTRSDVQNISMKIPRAMDTLRLVETIRGPGSMASMTAAALIPASICAIQYKSARTGFIAPIKDKPSVAAGLNKPPLTLKKNPYIDHQAKPETQGNVEKDVSVWWLTCCRRVSGRGMGDLGATEGKEKKHEGPNEFGSCSNGFVEPNDGVDRARRWRAVGLTTGT